MPTSDTRIRRRRRYHRQAQIVRHRLRPRQMPAIADQRHLRKPLRIHDGLCLAQILQRRGGRCSIQMRSLGTPRCIA